MRESGLILRSRSGAFRFSLWECLISRTSGFYQDQVLAYFSGLGG